MEDQYRTHAQPVVGGRPPSRRCLVPAVQNPEADLQVAGAGLGARGDRESTARDGVYVDRETGEEMRVSSRTPPPGAVGVGPAAHPGEPARLPSLRAADRPRRQRLSVLRPAPVGSRRIEPAAIRATALLLTGPLAFGALVGIGCGDDEDEVTPADDLGSSVPEARPSQDHADARRRATDAPGPAALQPERERPNQEDSATNDKPPSPGQPEEAFEKVCEQNPAACG